MTKSRLCDPNIAEAAEILGVSKLFIRRRITDGSLDAYRIKGSRLIRIRQESLEAMKVAL